MSRALNDELTGGVATKEDLAHAVVELKTEIAKFDAKFDTLNGKFETQGRYVFLGPRADCRARPLQRRRAARFRQRTHGFVAIHRKVLRRLPFEKIDNGYFFETDLLFRVGILMAKVVEVPIEAVYGEEKSGVRMSREAVPFFLKDVATARTVMLAGLPIISGLQMLISFVGHDISRQPTAAIHPRLFGDGRASVAVKPPDPAD